MYRESNWATASLLQLENPIELLSKALPMRCVRVEAIEALRR